METDSDKQLVAVAGKMYRRPEKQEEDSVNLSGAPEEEDKEEEDDEERHPLSRNASVVEDKQETEE